MVDVTAMKKVKEDKKVIGTVVKAKEEVQADIKPFEDTIKSNLRTLHSLRKMFVLDLRNRVRLVSGSLRVHTFPSFGFFPTLLIFLSRRSYYFVADSQTG